MPIAAVNRGNATTQASAPCCAPVCPDCGGLECLCRPRFFAGQLLTDDDLKRLDYYITAKNKLHNRYLMGWGVVCGLDVVCNACDGLVTVKSGYALSPCGEDIVVCSDASVDVCSMIQKCTRKQPSNCQPAQPTAGANDPCSSTTEQWVLSIHYDENMSRGIVPLKNTGSAACCSKCASGGSSSCACRSQSSSGGCGCGGSSTSRSNGNGGSGCSCGCSGSSTTSSSMSSSTQAQCQPTLVCESYRFEVCKVQPQLRPKKPVGAIVQRFLNCFTALQGLISAPPASDDPTEVQNWCCAIRQNLLDFFADNPGYTCSIPQKLALLCQQGTDVQTIKSQVAFLLAQYIKDCFCSIFLPPCPCPVEDASVPLATITVSKINGQCRIVSICNLDVRKFLTTFPNLAYWLSVFPTIRDLRAALANFCCKPLKQRETQFGRTNEAEAFRMSTGPQPAGTAGTQATATNVASPFQQSHTLAELILQELSKKDQPVDAQTLAFASLGLSDAKGQPFLSTTEMNQPLETLMLNQFAIPFAQAVVPPSLGRFFGLASTFSSSTSQPGTTPQPAAGPTPAQPDVNSQIEDLKTQINDMREQLKHSQSQIERLSKRRNQ